MVASHGDRFASRWCWTSGRLPRATASPVHDRRQLAGTVRPRRRRRTAVRCPRPMGSRKFLPLPACRTNASKSRCPSDPSDSRDRDALREQRGRSSIREPWPATRGVFAVTSRAGARSSRSLRAFTSRLRGPGGFSLIEPRGHWRQESRRSCRIPDSRPDAPNRMRSLVLAFAHARRSGARGARDRPRLRHAFPRGARDPRKSSSSSDTVLTSFLRDVDVTI